MFKKLFKKLKKGISSVAKKAVGAIGKVAKIAGGAILNSIPGAGLIKAGIGLVGGLFGGGGSAPAEQAVPAAPEESGGGGGGPQRQGGHQGGAASTGKKWYENILLWVGVALAGILGFIFLRPKSGRKSY